MTTPSDLLSMKQLGITINANHTLPLDKTTLQQAWDNNPSGVTQKFASDTQGTPSRSSI